MRFVLIQKILKVGHSLAVVLPKHVAVQLGYQRGDQVEIVCVAPDQILIRKFNPTPK